MTYTYDLNEGGVLTIFASPQEREELKELRDEYKREAEVEYEALDQLICNSELEWIRPEEIGALTSTPILGIKNDLDQVIAAWGFMDYAMRSFVDDLIDTGKAVFIS